MLDCQFHFHGSVAPVDHPECVTCLALRSKKCPTHGLGYAKGCAHCASAQGAACQAHWGLDAALKAHKADVNEESKGAYDDAAGKILAAVKMAPKATVFADFRASFDPTTSLYEYFVSVRMH
jgi:hypothetical protein